MRRRVAFAVPGDLATPTGGYKYEARVIAELRGLGFAVDVVDLGEGFPHPRAEIRAAALARLAEIRPGVPIMIDGLALGVLPEIAALRRRNPLIGLVHHPLALETGVAPQQAERLRASERAALASMQSIVVDIGRAQQVLRSVLEPLNYRNLDDLPQFKDTNTTTEFLAKYLFGELARAVRNGELGRSPSEMAAIRVTVAESPLARAFYEASLS